jgi:hypothetical protein
MTTRSNQVNLEELLQAIEAQRSLMISVVPAGRLSSRSTTSMANVAMQLQKAWPGWASRIRIPIPTYGIGMASGAVATFLRTNHADSIYESFMSLLSNAYNNCFEAVSLFQAVPYESLSAGQE